MTSQKKNEESGSERPATASVTTADSVAREATNEGGKKPGLFAKLKNHEQSRKTTYFPVDEAYLETYKDPVNRYRSIFGRLLRAMGEITEIDTTTSGRLNAIYQGKPILRPAAFENEFFGGEMDDGGDVLTRFVNHMREAESGGAARKKIVCFVGPVAGGKTTMSFVTKKLAEIYPMEVLCLKETKELSPAKDHPLSLFPANLYSKEFQDKYEINPRLLASDPSEWVMQHIKDYAEENEMQVGDVDPSDIFEGARVYLTEKPQFGIAVVRPGSADTFNESDLVGGPDITLQGKLEVTASHPFAYDYNRGAFPKGHQGVVECPELMKAENSKVLQVFLDALESNIYSGTGGVGQNPLEALVLVHINIDEYEKFISDPENKAFISRTNFIPVPHTLCASEERKVLQKYINSTDDAKNPVAPHTLDLLAAFKIATSIYDPSQATEMASKIRIYDGEELSANDPLATYTRQQYRSEVKKEHEKDKGLAAAEGMFGIDRRIIFDAITKAFSQNESRMGGKSLDPLKVFNALADEIKNVRNIKKMSDKDAERYLGLIETFMKPEYAKRINVSVRNAALASSEDYAQQLFEEYTGWLKPWNKKNRAFFHAGAHMSLEDLDKKMRVLLEDKAEIGNSVRDSFRTRLGQLVLEHRDENNGKNPSWKEIQPFRDAFEQMLLHTDKDVLRIVSFSAKQNEDDVKAHSSFLSRMLAEGKEEGCRRTPEGVRQEVEWYMSKKDTYLPKP